MGLGARTGAETRRFGRSAGLLSAGIGAAGVVTYVFFALASHNLEPTEYGEIVVLWSAVFVTIAVAHRPVELLLSRTLADRNARGEETQSALRVALGIQLAVSAALGVAALALREPLRDELLGGDEVLYWVLVVAVVTFGASFYVRGLLAGTRRFGWLSLLLLGEATLRTGFALAVAVGLASGQEAIALGVAAAPLLSVALAPLLIAARPRAGVPEPPAPSASVTVASGGGFAAAVLVVMLGEQAFLNGGPLVVRAFEDAAAAGFVFNVLMVARAPVLVFQGVAISLLPHLTRLRARGGEGARAFGASIGLTLQAIAVFTAGTLAVLALAGPELMQIAFGERYSYERTELVLVGAGMGLYLAATTLSQAALARGDAGPAARCWAVAAAAFLAWCLLPLVGDEVRRVEVGFTLASALLAGLLALVHRAGGHGGIEPGSPEEVEARLASADEAA